MESDTQLTNKSISNFRCSNLRHCKYFFEFEESVSYSGDFDLALLNSIIGLIDCEDHLGQSVNQLPSGFVFDNGEVTAYNKFVRWLLHNPGA